jgi:hypothetical protein
MRGAEQRHATRGATHAADVVHSPSSNEGDGNMTRKDWIHCGPSLLVGTGIIVATIAAALAAESGWWVLTGPLFLAVTVVVADMMDSRLRGDPSAPSHAALSMGTALLLAVVMVTRRDPELVKTLIPIIGPATWVAIRLRSGGRRQACMWNQR